MVEALAKPKNGCHVMDNGNKAVDGNFLKIESNEVDCLQFPASAREKFVRRFMGAAEAIKGKIKFCIWVTDDAYAEARTFRVGKAFPTSSHPKIGKSEKAYTRHRGDTV